MLRRGALGGADSVYSFFWGDLSGLLELWNGAEYVAAKTVGVVAVTIGAAEVELTIDPANFGEIEDSLQIAIYAFGGPPGTQPDRAPDAGFFGYSMLPALESVFGSFKPNKPKAGRVFRLSGVNLQLENGDEVAPDSYSCKARLGRRALRGTGPGRCKWLIPASAHGKRLLVTITATHGDQTVTFEPYQFRVT